MVRRVQRRRRIASAAGAVAMAGGCVVAVASLWSAWAVDGPHAGRAQDRSGWDWMAYGDVMIAVVSAVVLALGVVMLCGQRRPGIAFSAGIGSIVLLGGTLAGVAFVWKATGFTLIVMDDGDLASHQPGPGPARAAIGLGVALLGSLIALPARQALLSVGRIVPPHDDEPVTA